MRAFDKILDIFRIGKTDYSGEYPTIYTDPNSIEYGIFPHAVEDLVGCDTIGGNWDQNVRSDRTITPYSNRGRHTRMKSDLFSARWKLENYEHYTSFFQHFTEGTSWDETSFYDRLIEDIHKNHNRYGTSVQEIHDRFSYIDSLYEDIKESGYKQQQELRENDRSSDKPVEYDEITVYIGRGGQLFFGHTGAHRLTISQILDIDEIPVRVLARHEEWETKRDSVDSGEHTK
jgi:hypothetical protein